MSRKAEATRVFEKILCPVDFSDCSAAALRYANALARCQEADVTVLHADSFTAPAYFTPAQVEHFLQQCEFGRPVRKMLWSSSSGKPSAGHILSSKIFVCLKAALRKQS